MSKMEVPASCLHPVITANWLAAFGPFLTIQSCMNACANGHDLEQLKNTAQKHGLVNISSPISRPVQPAAKVLKEPTMVHTLAKELLETGIALIPELLTADQLRCMQISF